VFEDRDEALRSDGSGHFASQGRALRGRHMVEDAGCECNVERGGLGGQQRRLRSEAVLHLRIPSRSHLDHAGRHVDADDAPKFLDEVGVGRADAATDIEDRERARLPEWAGELDEAHGLSARKDFVRPAAGPDRLLDGLLVGVGVLVEGHRRLARHQPSDGESRRDVSSEPGPRTTVEAEQHRRESRMALPLRFAVVSIYSYADVRRKSLRDRFGHHFRVLRVIARVEFKLKYADSALGYVWSLVKPLSYFGLLWVVFGRFFKLNAVREYPLYLFVGIVLYTFLVDAISVALPSVVVRGGIIRRIAFPRIVIPTAATLTAGITFLVNAAAVAVFVAVAGISPRWEWLLIPPLLLELYVLILGLALLVSALFVRFRDLSQVWELAATLLFYASPIMYPVVFLPKWAQPIILANPFVQIIQDIRNALIGVNQPLETIRAVYGTSLAYVIPLGIVAILLGLGLWFFSHEAPDFAERV
jgi:ABC-2 type transport system permease protein